MTSQTKPYGTVLLKAADIITVLAQSKQPLALNAVAKQTGLTSSTTLKILETLILIGYVRRDSHVKGFSLGSTLVQHASEFVSNLNITRVAYPYMKQLHSEFDETVHLGILDGDHVVCINKLETKKPVVCLNANLGNSKPLYCTSMGKAILSGFAPGQIDRYLETHTLEAKTDRTITNPIILREHLRMVFAQGYAVDDNEIENDVYCLGVSIIGDGIPAAISISTPYYRMNPEIKERMVGMLLAVKKNITEEISK